MRYVLGETLQEYQEEIMEKDRPSVFLATSQTARDCLEQAGMQYEGEINLKDVGFCKMETQQECLAGSLCIPKLLDILGERYKILFFINRHHIVIVDDDEFSYRLIRRIKRKKTRQGESKEKFIYNFMLEFISRDLELLGHYEKRIMDLEEGVMDGKIQGFQNAIMPIRRELLTLRSYYDEIMDMGKQLEENENGFFAKKQVKYFGVISDRADRLMSKASQLLEYAQQVRDAYKAQVDAQQNNNMQLKLLAFMRTEEYKEVLIRYIEKAAQFASGMAMTIYINPSDADKKTYLEERTGMTLTISKVDFIGGVRAVVPEKNVLVDYAFKGALENEYQKFQFRGGVKGE